ncbi:MAG: hypothetical protein V1754_14760 [Pseudomonadota bacterium]
MYTHFFIDIPLHPPDSIADLSAAGGLAVMPQLVCVGSFPEEQSLECSRNLGRSVHGESCTHYLLETYLSSLIQIVIRNLFELFFERKVTPLLLAQWEAAFFVL